MQLIDSVSPVDKVCFFSCQEAAGYWQIVGRKNGLYECVSKNIFLAQGEE